MVKVKQNGLSLTQKFHIKTEKHRKTFTQTLNWLKTIDAIIESESASKITAKHEVKFPSYPSNYKLKHFNPMNWNKQIIIEFESTDSSSLVFTIISLENNETYDSLLPVWWSVLIKDYADLLGLEYELPVQTDNKQENELKKQLRESTRKIIIVIILQLLLSVFFAFSPLQSVIRLVLCGTLLLGVVVFSYDLYKGYNVVETQLKSLFGPLKST